jgi:hypothetical protein
VSTIRDALEVSAEMYKKDSNNVSDYVQRHLISLSIWEELRYAYSNFLLNFIYFSLTLIFQSLVTGISIALNKDLFSFIFPSVYFDLIITSDFSYFAFRASCVILLWHFCIELLIFAKKKNGNFRWSV